MLRDDNVVARASCSFTDKLMRRRATVTDKAIVNYTSPALCTPVTPFPPIGDAAYNQHAGGSSHGHRQHAQILLKIARVVPEISSRTDTCTHTQTYSSQYFATAPADEVKTTCMYYNCTCN